MTERSIPAMPAAGGAPPDTPSPARSDTRELRPESLPPETRKSLTASADQIPSLWLDRLLQAGCDLPIEEGIGAVARALVAAVAAILPDVAVGLCVAATPEEGGQVVVRYVPHGRASTTDPDPARLFPGLGREAVVPIAGDPPGSTLHGAAANVDLESEDSPEAALLARAGISAASALRAARAVAAARRASQELRTLQAQIIHSERLASLGQIAAGVVHELNNPLTSIVAYSDFLRRKAERDRSDPADIERLRRIGEAADRILRFSRDLVAYSRPSSEVPAPVAIDAVIDQALVFCEHVLGGSAVVVERTLAPDVRPVRGVPGQLTQVFVNLFTNACHAMAAAGGRLTIATAWDPAADVVRVAVTDTGHGIAPEHVVRIFEPFFTTKTDGRGTGLGLSIVRNIVEAHAGTIRVESRPGATRFVIELPVAVRPSTTPPPPTSGGR